jgi:phosphatidate cytidylyltransferase
MNASPQSTPQKTKSGRQEVKKNWKDLGPRLASAGVLLAVTILVVWLGGIWFALLLSLVFAGIYREWEVMISTAPLISSGYVLVGLMALVPLGVAIAGIWAGGVLMLAGIGVAATGGRELFAWRAGGLAFFSLVVVSLVLVRGSALIGFAACFFLGASVWMTDTGAFFTGRIFGGAKLNTDISPAKTWSGAVGGLIVGTLSGLLVWIVVTPSPWWIGLALAALVSLSGQIGDLSESAVKRRFAIKDTSDLIPGHGGLLDRLDSLTFGALMVLAIGAVNFGLDGVAKGLLIW